MFPFVSEPSNHNDNTSTPGVSDFMKFASSLLAGNNETGSIFNSPEFTQSMESMTRALLNTLNNTSNSNNSSNCGNANSTSSTNLISKNTNSTCRTKNLILQLPVTLEELYRGKQKKVTVKRKRAYEQSDKSFKIVEERKTLLVTIERGYRDDHRIVFPNEADEIPGFDTGDVVIILKEQQHNDFIRCCDDLMITRNISISELFYFDSVVTHLDGSAIRIQNTVNDLLSEYGCIRKIVGKGMPVTNNSETFGDLFIQFNIVPVLNNDVELPEKNKLYELFPPMNVLPEQNDDVIYEMSKLNDDDFFKLDQIEENNMNDNCSCDEEEEDEEEEEEEDDEEDEEEEDDGEEDEEEEDDDDDGEEDDGEEDDNNNNKKNKYSNIIINNNYIQQAEEFQEAEVEEVAVEEIEEVN